jgi:hypothetical protein
MTPAPYFRSRLYQGFEAAQGADEPWDGSPDS